MGKTLIIVGAAILVLGLLLEYAPFLINWFGKLPGDINVKTENTQVFIPITSMIIVSLLLTLIVNLFFRK